MIDGKTKKADIPQLTSVRIFFALMVVFYHLAVHTQILAQNALTSTGYVGVNFFFILSGFILSYSLPPSRPHFVSQFYIGRVARIYPVYLLSVLAFFLLTKFSSFPESIVPVIQSEYRLSFLLNVALLQAWFPDYVLQWNSVGWSLSCEAFFYLLFPFLFQFFAKLQKQHFYIVATICYVLSLLPCVLATVFEWTSVSRANALNFHEFTGDKMALVLMFNPIFRLPEFVLGMAGFFLFKHHEAIIRTRASLLFFGGLVGIGLGMIFGEHIPFLMMHNGFLGCFVLMLILGLISSKCFPSRILASPFFVLLGKASYSVYLFHVILIFFLFEFFFSRSRFLSPLGMLLCYITVLLSVSMLIYSFYEAPFHRKIKSAILSKLQ